MRCDRAAPSAPSSSSSTIASIVARIRSRSRSSSAPFPGLPLLLSISMASSSGTRRQADVSCGSTRRILAPFYFFHQPPDTTVQYSTAIQPYALKLFFALFLIDIIVTWIQYSAEGQLDPSFFFGRMIKHVLSGGFVYLMIINGFSWMYLVIQSFSR